VLIGLLNFNGSHQKADLTTRQTIKASTVQKAEVKKEGNEGNR